MNGVKRNIIARLRPEKRKADGSLHLRLPPVSMNPLRLLSVGFLVLLTALPNFSFDSEVNWRSPESVEEGSLPGVNWADAPNGFLNHKLYHSSEERGDELNRRPHWPPHWHPGPLCHPCKELFKLVKERVKDVAHLEKPQLQGMIDDACKQLHEPLLEHVCRKIGAKELDRLFDLIVNKDKLIDPDHACKALHACT
ncbi:hypothetical protein M3Y99_01342300 [Aphelenchoides fujianensis]|nr:hypothetical protein M3Y99_01342300 [Aphelenchoides fujianensis]